jgi:hypothetical protein
MARWRRDALAVIGCNLWRARIGIMSVAHGPLDHHFNFLKKAPPVEGNVPGQLAALVCGKAREVYNELVALLIRPVWACRLVEDSPPDISPQFPDLLCLGVEVMSNHAAGYQRRVLAPVERSRLRVWRRCSSIAPHRLARRLLSTGVNLTSTDLDFKGEWPVR